jgi:protein phosphatase
MMELRFAAATSVGRVREVNEDSWLARDGLFVVADGMGGHAAGELAGSLAVEVMGQLDVDGRLETSGITSSIRRANEVILRRSLISPETSGMGTTLTGLARIRIGGVEHWAVFNVGDSRVYRFVDGGLRQLTIDHSEVQELMASGMITGQEARTHPNRHVITRSLGGSRVVEPDVWVLPANTGERFLICSDGLTDELDDHEIEALLTGRSPQDAAARLVAAAEDAGGHDNVTVLVVDVLAARDEFDDIDDTTSPRLPRTADA